MSHFDIAKLEETLKALENKTADSSFWNESIETQKKTLQKLRNVKNKVTNYKKVEKEINDTIELSELLNGAEDEGLVKEIIKNTKNEQKELTKLEIETLFSGKLLHKYFRISSFVLYFNEKKSDIFLHKEE